MNYHEKSKEELFKDLQDLLAEHRALKASYEEDITQREQAEKELSASEDRFKQVAESTGVWIWEVDAEGLYTYASPVVEKILGYTPGDLVGKKHFYELFHTEYSEETKTNALKLFATKQPIKELLNQNVHKDGSLVWLSTTGHPILDKKGILIGYRGADTDITEKKKVEEALKESEYFFKESQKAAFIGSYKSDFTLGQWESSEVLDRIFGIDKNFNRTVPGWIDIVHPDDREMMSKYLMEEVIGQHKPFNKEYRIIRKNDGQVRWVLGLGTGEYDDSGNFLSLIGTIQDITERKQSEYEIRRLNRAVEATGEVVFVTDTEGIFTYVNPAFTEVYGHQASEVIGKVTPRILKSGEMEAAAYISFWQDLLNKRVVKGEIINLTKDGRKIHIESSSNAIVDEADDISGFVAIQKDITRRKEIEEELVCAKEKAEESDRLKTAFLANMSHEIRTPMNGILGFAALLREANLTPDRQEHYINTIQVSGKRMLSTINSILDVSKIESGLINVELSEANLNERIEFVHRFFKREAENKGLKISFKAGLSSEDAVIRTDHEKIYGILTNFIQNAIKFTNEGTIEFGYKRKGAFLEFFVKDTGMGVPPGQQEIIFERFRQGSESISRGYDGNGLGLYISKTYAEMLDGKIWVESKKGQGSVFYLRIPYQSASEKNKKSADVVHLEHNNLQKNKLKILIAEDDEISHSLLETTLEKISKELLHAKTGLEAIELCKNNSDIDLVLMDLRMPELNGYEACRQIRKFNKEVVIVAQTAYAMAGDREEALEAGCNDYISKPISKAELFALLQKYFRDKT